MGHKINREWLEIEFEKLKVMHQVITRAQALRDALKEKARQKIIRDDLDSSEFLALAVAFRFASDLITERHYLPSADIHARCRQEVIPRETMPYDVSDSISKINEYWHSHYPLLKKLAADNDIPKKASAGAWLDLIISAGNDFMVERMGLGYRVTDEIPPVTTEHVLHYGSVDLITSEFEKMIRYHEYGLSEETEIAVKSSPPLMYSLSEVSKRWDTNEKNVISVCMKSKKFWAYINITKELQLQDFKNKKTTLDIKEQMRRGEIDRGYKYSSSKFARLAKSTTVNSGYTLEYFYSNTVIHAKRGQLTLIWIDPPLCSRVLGIYVQHLEADHDVTPSLFFKQDEIHKFEKTDKFFKIFPKTAVSSCASDFVLLDADDQPLERRVVIENYQKLSPHAWEKIFQREQSNGLISAKIPEKSPFQYSEKKLEKWLITKGYYSASDFTKSVGDAKSRGLHV